MDWGWDQKLAQSCLQSWCLASWPSSFPEEEIPKATFSTAKGVLKWELGKMADSKEGFFQYDFAKYRI